MTLIQPNVPSPNHFSIRYSCNSIMFTLVFLPFYFLIIINYFFRFYILQQLKILMNTRKHINCFNSVITQISLPNCWKQHITCSSFHLDCINYLEFSRQKKICFYHFISIISTNEISHLLTSFRLLLIRFPVLVVSFFLFFFELFDGSTLLREPPFAHSRSVLLYSRRYILFIC